MITIKNILAAALALTCLSTSMSCRKELNAYGTYVNQPDPDPEYGEALLVYFKDKNQKEFSLNKASAFLSERAIKRRQDQKIAIDSTDLPVSPTYIKELLKHSNAKLLNSSKWLNYAVIHLPKDYKEVSSIEKLASVAKVRSLGAHRNYEEPVIPPVIDENILDSKVSTADLDKMEISQSNYGNTFFLLEQYNANFLHEKHFFGKGKLIALMGIGFGYINEKAEIAHLLSEKKIVDTYDFLFNRSDLRTTTPKGNNQLALMGALKPNHYIGMAPGAEFALFRTDQHGNQEPFFETSWVAALERADSIGVDIVSSSQIYGIQFNQPEFDIKPETADGRAISSLAADAAFSKGILTVQMQPQKSGKLNFTLPPTDAKNILTVGNIDRQNRPIYSAINKPTADGRLKPELGALSFDIPVIYGYSNSYSSGETPPIIAGLLACLWEALPGKTAKEIKTLIQETASQADNPDNKIGYGIPNFKNAYEKSNK